jgi:hypothetical protein
MCRKGRQTANFLAVWRQYLLSKVKEKAETFPLFPCPLKEGQKAL